MAKIERNLKTEITIMDDWGTRIRADEYCRHVAVSVSGDAGMLLPKHAIRFAKRLQEFAERIQAREDE